MEPERRAQADAALEPRRPAPISFANVTIFEGRERTYGAFREHRRSIQSKTKCSWATFVSSCPAFHMCTAMAGILESGKEPERQLQSMSSAPPRFDLDESMLIQIT